MTARVPLLPEAWDTHLGMRTPPSSSRVAGYRQDDGAGQERG